ncbi:Bax inhibitor-1/YccA family protein ['Fragaria x ananassa' phyllody phytoplasma]|uniref:Bax inhibitor-1/YccA family protein n=1 Tax='Fragaria x ananassa' phyllody phytoplasma TaxID=2358428 RepID=A0ABS5K4W6_9MOLU|nr:Bax inhibitor-1/YccA family protein ['Fragaria x ananassa' phyllody phytoplasma]MBS2126365.1 Bax inhibitor-1/YccA family protein ['Fragaria x ananassa' phyllody phytoplasma]
MKSNNNIIKVNDSLEKIKNTFLSFDETNDYKLQANRKGIAFKTILLLLITSITAIAFFMIFKNRLNIGNYGVSSLYYVMLILCFASIFVYQMGMTQIHNSKMLSLLYVFIEGLFLSVLLIFVNVVYNKWIDIAFIAIFSTVIVFLIMAHAYYKGILKVTNRFRTIMFNCGAALLIAYLVRLVLIMFGIGTLENIIHHSILTIPISLVMLVFVSLQLALNFDYTEKMIQQGMPKKYEWQISLIFASTLIHIFIRIFSLLLRLMGDTKK